MRKNFGAKPYSTPQPVYIIATYNENGSVNAMNAAWGCMSDYTEITLFLSKNHKTVENILRTGAFTVSMANEKYVIACDYVGIVSGNKDSSKFEKAGFHATKSEFVNAPLINELEIAVECELMSYDEISERLVGKIINVSVDERALDEKGNVDLSKVSPITFDPFNNAYIKLGQKVGNAFKDGMKLK